MSCGTCGAAAVGVGVAFGPCLHCWITKPSWQSVFSFHFSEYFLENASSAFCWFWDCSVCLIVSLACASDCCVAFWTLVTSKT